MNLYLVRHGQAESPTVDPRRPLSSRGARDVGQVAERAAERGVRVDRILHSGVLRAEQTAAILASRLSPTGGCESTPGLRPNDDVDSAAAWLAHESDNLMLVGHLPFMDLLAMRLAASDGDDPPTRFDTATMACLERGADGWRILWTLTPDA